VHLRDDSVSSTDSASEAADADAYPVPSPAKTVTSTAGASEGPRKQTPPVSHAAHQSASQKAALMAQAEQEARSPRKCITAAGG
jgi:hypothetical protein